MSGDYEGKFEGSVDESRQGIFCEAELYSVVHQGRDVFILYFLKIFFFFFFCWETLCIYYGELGHSVVKDMKSSGLRSTQIAILRDIFEYLGE